MSSKYCEIFFLKLPVHKSVCVFFKGIYHQFQVGFLLQHILRTDDLKKKKKIFFSIQYYCFDELMPTNVVSIVSRFSKSLYSLHGQPNPTSVLDYLIFSHLQTQKWKCRGIWATLFGSRTRIVGTVHRLSHIGLLNTKYGIERTPSLHGKAFVWEASFLQLREYRKVFPKRLYKRFLLVAAYLSSVFLFFKYPLLINSILSILSKDSKFPQYICIQFYCFVLDILLCKCSRHFLVNTMFLSPKLYSKLLNNKNHALPPTWIFFFYYDCIKPINLFWLNDIFTIFHISS